MHRRIRIAISLLCIALGSSCLLFLGTQPWRPSVTAQTMPSRTATFTSTFISTPIPTLTPSSTFTPTPTIRPDVSIIGLTCSVQHDLVTMHYELQNNTSIVQSVVIEYWVDGQWHGEGSAQIGVRRIYSGIRSSSDFVFGVEVDIRIINRTTRVLMDQASMTIECELPTPTPTITPTPTPTICSSVCLPPADVPCGSVCPSPIPTVCGSSCLPITPTPGHWYLYFPQI